mgnify:FL=1
MKVSNKDYKIIKKQLEREPDNLLEVVKRCPFSYPAVLTVKPYENSIVFPTTYWLSCPYFVKEVGKIEDKGLIQKLTLKLKNDREFRSSLKKAHQHYANKRLEYLDKKLEELPDGIRDVIENSGVGGIIDKEGVKCLHTHLADYLVNGLNPVGEIVFNKLNWPDNCDICNKLIDK